MNKVSVEWILKYLSETGSLWAVSVTQEFQAKITVNRTPQQHSLEYHGITRSILWLLMPWLLVLPGHQQSQYWLCRIFRPMTSWRKDFNRLHDLSVKKWYQMQAYLYGFSNKFSFKRVKNSRHDIHPLIMQYLLESGHVQHNIFNAGLMVVLQTKEAMIHTLTSYQFKMI